MPITSITPSFLSGKLLAEQTGYRGEDQPGSHSSHLNTESGSNVPEQLTANSLRGTAHPLSSLYITSKLERDVAERSQPHTEFQGAGVRGQRRE